MSQRDHAPKPTRIYMVKPERPHKANRDDFELAWSVLSCARDLRDFGTVAAACRALDAIMTRAPMRQDDRRALVRYFK